MGSDKGFLSSDEFDHFKGIADKAGMATRADYTLHQIEHIEQPGIYDFPIVLPDPWAMGEQGTNGYVYINKLTSTTVQASVHKEKDNRWWLHLALCGLRQPDDREILKVVDMFAGSRVRNNPVIRFYPEVERYSGQHPNTIHLWVPLQDIGLPNLERYK